MLAHESRPDGRAVSEDTGYQASFRYGSHQSLTRDWSMPMHQTDSLFHKSKDAQHFVFGYEADNHAGTPCRRRRSSGSSSPRQADCADKAIGSRARPGARPGSRAPRWWTTCSAATSGGWADEPAPRPDAST